MKKNTIFAIVCLVVIGLYCGFAIPAELRIGDIYSGKVVFNSESDYQVFKNELVKSEALWNSMESLSSQPPIIVKFSVDVNKNYDFPYGKKDTLNRVFVLVLPTLLLALLLITIGISLNKEEIDG